MVITYKINIIISIFRVFVYGYDLYHISHVDAVILTQKFGQCTRNTSYIMKRRKYVLYFRTKS